MFGTPSCFQTDTGQPSIVCTLGPLDDPGTAPIRLLDGNGTTLAQQFMVNNFVLFHGSHVILGHNYTLALSAIEQTVVSLESKSLSVAFAKVRCCYLHIFVRQRHMQVARKFEFGCIDCLMAATCFSMQQIMRPSLFVSTPCDYIFFQ